MVNVVVVVAIIIVVIILCYFYAFISRQCTGFHKLSVGLSVLQLAPRVVRSAAVQLCARAVPMASGGNPHQRRRAQVPYKSDFHFCCITFILTFI